MTYYTYKNIKPVVSPSAYVHETAVVIGDVVIGENVYVAPHTVLRGDCARLTLMKGSNLQDGCIMHALSGHETIVEENGHIGHGAIIHGCVIKENALVGMNSVVMDGAVLGKNSFLGANSLIPTYKKIPDNVLAMGNPAKVIRELTEADLAWKIDGTKIYQKFAIGALAGDITKIDQPLNEIEANRPQLSDDLYTTLKDSKKR